MEPTFQEKLQALVEPLLAEREQIQQEIDEMREQISLRTNAISRIDRIHRAAVGPAEVEKQKKKKKGRTNGDSDWRPSVSEERVKVVLAGLREAGPITTGDLALVLDGVSPDQVSKAVRVGRLDGYIRLAGHSQKRGAPELWALTDRGAAFVNGKVDDGE